MRRSLQSALLLLFLVSCKPGPPPSQSAQPLMHPTTTTFDGFSLGDPVSAFLDKFGAACDSDPIDKERSTLFFWAGAEGCNEQKPFPDATTVVVITPYGKFEKEQPMELLAWFGGNYFNSRSTLKVLIGDSATEVDANLGEATHRHAIDNIAVGEAAITGLRQADYEGDIHVLIRDNKVVGIAVGKLKGGDERESTLDRGYAHHLKFVK